MRFRRLHASLLAAAAFASCPSAGFAQDGDGATSSMPVAAAAADTVSELRELSIEELANIEVRSASKQAEPLQRAPTSLYVITEDDILRSAATALPEVLRLAPNLQVQRLDGRLYAVSARGFNGYESSNKLLVLMDGRSIYTPLHAGVFWELHSPLLEDLKQIEVISGPGGTLYGPNAVNGVVSIVSKDARDTIGGLVRGTAGPDERTLAARYGVALGSTGALRVYANGFDRENLPPVGAVDFDDAFKGWQAGFRADFGGGADHVTVQGDVFDNQLDTGAGDGNKGHNILARWRHELGEGEAFQVQAYYDDFERRFTLVTDALKTFDLEAQYNGRFGAHELLVGAGMRTTRDRFVNNLNPFVLDPVSRRLWVLNAFVQDRFAVSPTFDVIAGLKVERSSFSGVEFLPNLRLAWHPNERNLLWAAVSRAVRTPSRIDRQLVALPLLAQATDFESEKLIAIEGGYRGQIGTSTSLSLSVFFNLYDDVRTTEFTGNPFPIRLRNNLKGHTYGIEAWANRQLTPWWRMSVGLATVSKRFRLKDGAVDLANRASLGMDPDVQVIARSQMDFTRRLSLDVSGRAMDDLGTTGRGGYVEADARLAWRASEAVELYVAGTNLLHDSHVESVDPGRAQRVERSVYAGTRLRF